MFDETIIWCYALHNYSVLHYLVLNLTTFVIIFTVNVIHSFFFIWGNLMGTIGGKAKCQRGQLSNIMASL